VALVKFVEVVSSLSPVCWICRQLLPVETPARLDEFGFPVHDDCLAKLEADKNFRAPGSPAK
jgi:hypothetical protein